MFAQLFGKYLIKNGEITKEKWNEVLDRRFEARAKLGTIAVEDGLLTQKQCDELNKLQMSEDKKFGDLAVEKGYLTQEQIDSLLIRQGSPYMQLLQVIVETADMPLSRVSGLVSQFQKDMGFSISEMTSFKNDNIDDMVPMYAACREKYVTDIAAIALRNLTRFISNDYYIEKLKRVESCDYKAFAFQRLHSADMSCQVCIGLIAPENTGGFVKIAEGFLGGKADGISEKIIIDAAGEFVNCTSGLFATALAQNEKIELEIMPQEKYENQTVKGNGYILPIFISDNEVDLFVAVNEEIEPGKDKYKGKVEKAEDSQASGSGKGRILIVDDSGMSRQVLRNLLEEEGYVVAGEAEDGEEGVEAYKRLKPDLVTLDITMPKKDGLQALKEIVQFDPSAKVIMITAVGQESKIIEALKSGAGKFLTKPFDRNEVRQEIAALLS